MRAIGSWTAATVPVTKFVILPSCIKINVPHVVNKLSATQQNIMAKITDLMRMSRGQRCVVGKRKVDGKEQRVIKGRGSSVKRELIQGEASSCVCVLIITVIHSAQGEEHRIFLKSSKFLPIISVLIKGVLYLMLA